MGEEKHKRLSLKNLKINFPLIIICLVGSMLRFFYLGRIILYWDEPHHTVKVAAQSLSYVVTHDKGSPLYQLLVHILLPLGKLEVVSRLPAALFGILTIVATYYVGKLLFGKTEGIIAALFVSFSSYFIIYSQYARGYTGFAFFSLLSLYFFYKAIKENKVKFWSLFIIFTVINTYTHFFSLVTVLIYISFVAFLLCEKSIKLKYRQSWAIDKKRLLHFIISILLIVLFTYLVRAPMLIGGTNVQNWVIDNATSFNKAQTIGFFSLIDKILTRQIGFSSIFYFISLFFIVLGITGCLIRLRKEYALLLIYIILPILSFVLIKPRMVFVISAHRYFIFILPLIFFLLAKGITFFSSIFIALVTRLDLIKKKEHFFRNLTITITILIFGFFILKTLNKNIHFWRLGSLNLSKSVHQYLKENVKRTEMIFFDSLPNKGAVLLVQPLSFHHREKTIMIYSVNRSWLKESPHKKLGLWCIFNRSLLKGKNLSNLNNDLLGMEIRNIDGNSMIHFEPGKKPLIKNLIKMVEFLIPLRPERGVENRLLLTKFYLLDQNIKQASRELEIIEKIKYAFSDEKQYTEESNYVFQFMEKILNIDNKIYHSFVQNKLYEDIGRLFFVLGNQFLSEGELDEAIHAYEKCVQVSDRYITRIAGKYAGIGNKFRRLGRIDEAISLLNKAVKLNPKAYMFHFYLAEAYRKKGLVNASINEYRKAFNMPSLSDKLISRIISQPQLFVIWKDNRTWHFMWRSEKICVFSGKIYFNKGIAKLRKYSFSKEEILNHYKKYEVEFRITTVNRMIKSLDIEVGKNSQLRCGVRINDQIKTDEIVFLNPGKNPKKIPFSHFIELR